MAADGGWAGSGFSRPVQWDGETAQPWVAPTRPCIDNTCPGRMEPEEDNDLRFWACPLCGSETGYTRVAAAVDACQLGLRLHFGDGAPPGTAAVHDGNGRHVFIGGDIPVRRPRAGD
jgi:hypothetical protein